MNRIKCTFSSFNTEIQKGFFSILYENWMSNSVHFKANSETLYNELSGEKMQKSPYVLFLCFMIHEPRDGCYGHTLHMNRDKLFILRNKNG